MNRRWNAQHLVLAAGALLWAGIGSAGAEPRAARRAARPPGEAHMKAVLGERVDSLARRVQGAKTRSEPLFAASLITANANRGPGMLLPENVALSEQMLRRFRGMGLTAVTFDVNFPILDVEYHRFMGASGDLMQRLTANYAHLAEAARANGLQVIVESSQVFTHEAYSSMPVEAYYRSLDLKTFEARRLAMFKRIATAMKPDWFTVSEESDTMEAVTGLKVNDPAVLIPMVGRAVTELRALQISGMKIGAGFGTWHPRWRALADGFLARADVDFLNLHVYPVGGRMDDVLFDAAALARVHHKDIVLGEVWLYKTLGGENINGAFDPIAFNRDSCACWADLDATFLQTIAQVARSEGYAYVSPFWSNLLFGYAACPPGEGVNPPAEVKRRANRAAAEATRNGGLSPSGAAWSQAARASSAKPASAD